MPASKRIRLGELLVSNHLLTEEQLQEALTEQKVLGTKLGRTVVKLGYLKEDDLLQFLAKQLNVPLIDLRKKEFNPAITSLLPEAYARRYHALVIDKQPTGLVVAMTDPTDINAQDELQRVLQAPLHFAIAREDDLTRTLDLVYRRTEDIKNFASELYEELGGETAILAAGPELENSPVVRLVEAIFQDAVQLGASDVHIEPDVDVLRIRQRVDGVLHEQIMKSKSIASAITLRLKLMSGLNISEKRLPQDGRFRIVIRGHDIDVRLSTMPTQFGESVVMRLLDQSTGILNLENVGMSEDILKRFRHLTHQPRGLVLVTGPTGSGKTTTLYGALSELNDTECKIITAEDPIEYYLPRVTQVQVNDKLELTFARVLRSAMRQDPDIMLVGEMRDEETAEIAMRAALTGHLVLSTLHANDSATSAIRMLDLGVEGFMVASTLRGVLAQRLVRRICPSCRTSIHLDDQDQAWVDGLRAKISFDKGFFTGAGCSQCNFTGFQGRVGLFELLEISGPMIAALQRKDPAEFSALAKSYLGDNLLLYNGLRMAAEGITTVEEVMRVAGDEDVD